MLLLLLLAAVQPPSPQREPSLASYLALAAAYRSPGHSAALAEIRKWPLPAVVAAADDLRRHADRFSAMATSPEDIDFADVEAAVLLHAEAGLAALRALSLAESEVHLRASTSLLDASRRAAARSRNLARMSASLDSRHERSASGPEMRERIAPVEYFQALAASALAMGFPETARPFAEEARQAAPLDARVQLLFGCVAESLAEVSTLRHRDSEARRLHEEAGRAMLDALALDPRLHEARLRLGRLLLVRGAAIQAESFLVDVERLSPDTRQRYLARLFLGRVAERRQGRVEAAGFYARALELWPDSQAARLGLAYALESQYGPAAARLVVGASLAASRRLDRADDPWWLYPFGPPGVAEAAVTHAWRRALDR